MTAEVGVESNIYITDAFVYGDSWDFRSSLALLWPCISESSYLSHVTAILLLFYTSTSILIPSLANLSSRPTSSIYSCTPYAIKPSLSIQPSSFPLMCHALLMPWSWFRSLFLLRSRGLVVEVCVRCRRAIMFVFDCHCSRLTCSRDVGT